MHLCLDIGNTWVKIGLFEKLQLIEYRAIRNSILEELSELLRTRKIIHSIVSNTRNVSNTILELLQQETNFVNFNHLTPLPIQINYSSPETLGKDRIAAAVGAYMLNPQKTHLIIDAGTCITFDVLKQGGIFLGGNIAPGIEMRIKAMHQLTGHLPLVEKVLPPDLLGINTETALQNGAIRGTIFEIQAFIREINTHYQSVNKILTGGDAFFLVEKLKTKIFVSPNLVLQGLNQIIIFNAKANT